jgi:hypothetical protein
MKKGMETEILWLKFKNGAPDAAGLQTPDSYKKAFTPLVEVKPFTPSITLDITGKDNGKIIKELGDFFSQIVKSKKYYPGRYGDWMKTTKITIDDHVFLNVDCIGPGAWNKPTLAADLGIFVRTTTAVYYVGIVRKADPGKGLPAHIGGICEAGAELDSAAYTMLKETLEEGNLKIDYKGNVKELQLQYEIKKIPVVVKGFGKISRKLKEIVTDIHHVTMIPTPEVERNADGWKRVYATTAFAIMINLGSIEVTPDDLLKVFTAGDDASAMYVGDVSADFKKGRVVYDKLHFVPEFGLPHHGPMFVEMVKKLRQMYPTKLLR